MKATDKVFSAVVSHWLTNFVPPTRRDLIYSTGISSSSVITYHLHKLVRDGRIHMIRSKPVPAEIIKALQEIQHA